MQVKRNNPGNIRKSSAFTWQGEVPGTSPGEFVTFDSLENGYRAMLKLLNNYLKLGFNTLTKIINRYAPTSDNNNPENYIRFVSNSAGINPQKIISVNDFSILENIAYSMSLFEHGVQSDDGTLQAALKKAKEILTGLIETVKNNPGKSLALIAVAGILIYLILTD